MIKACGQCGTRYEEKNEYAPQYDYCPHCGAHLAEVKKTISPKRKKMTRVAAVILCTAAVCVGTGALVLRLLPKPAQDATYRQALETPEEPKQYIEAIHAAERAAEISCFIDVFLNQRSTDPAPYYDIAEALKGRGWDMYALRVLNMGRFNTGDTGLYNKIHEYWDYPWQVQEIKGGFTLLGDMLAEDGDYETVTWEMVESIRYLEIGSEYYNPTDTGSSYASWIRFSDRDPAEFDNHIEFLSDSTTYVFPDEEQIKNLRGIFQQDGTPEGGFPVLIFLNLAVLKTSEASLITTDLVGSLPYLRELDMGIYLNLSVLPGSTPEALELDSVFAPLGTLPSLKKLVLHDSISDSSGSIPSVESLEISGSDIEALDVVYSFPNLTSLWVVDAENIFDLSPLSGMEGLESLSIKRCPIVDFSPISTLKNLKSLTLDDTNIVDYYAASSLPQLKNLTVQSAIPGVLGIMLPSAGDFPALDTLYMDSAPDDSIRKQTTLSGVGIGEASNLKMLANMAGLKDLRLHSCSGYAGMERLASVESLRISGSIPTDLSQLGMLVNLQSLTMDGEPPDEIARVVNAAPGLRQLTLNDIAGGSPPQDYADMMDAIGAQTELTDLVIQNILTHEMLDLGPYTSSLSGLANMERLTMRYTGITDISFTSDMQELYYADFFCNYIGDFGPAFELDSLRYIDGAAN